MKYLHRVPNEIKTEVALIHLNNILLRLAYEIYMLAFFRKKNVVDYKVSSWITLKLT